MLSSCELFSSTDSAPVDVRYLFLYSLGQKITTCIIAHRVIAHDVTVRYLLLYSVGQKITTCIIAHRVIVHRDGTSRCAISVFVFSWPENHNMPHRTSSHRHRPSRHQSMCDICSCISPGRTGARADTTCASLRKDRPARARRTRCKGRTPTRASTRARAAPTLRGAAQCNMFQQQHQLRAT